MFNRQLELKRIVKTIGETNEKHSIDSNELKLK